MNNIDELLELETEEYERASPDERMAIAQRMAILLRVKEKTTNWELEAQRLELEDERERMKIENERYDAEERRIIESNRLTLDEEVAQNDLVIRQTQLESEKSAERTTVVVKILEGLGLIVRDLIGIRASRRDMHELMRFEKSPEGYNIMSSQSSKKFWINRKGK